MKTENVASLSRRIGRVAGNTLARRDLRGIARQILLVLAWGAAAVFLGTVVGFASVFFPPTGTFGAVAVAAAVLLWVAPDVPSVTDKTVRKFLYVSMVVILCVPSYYALIVPSLPQISIRRVTTVPFICLSLWYVSTSAEARAHLISIVRDARFIVICAVGFLAMIFVSVTTSINSSGSLSQATDALLEWYIPFFAVLSVIRSERDVMFLLRIICVCALFVAMIGIADTLTQRNLMVKILPAPIFEHLMQDKSFAQMINLPQYRNGMYRAPSVFGVSLSFGEFESMVALLGAFFFLYARSFRDRMFGGVVVVSGFLGVVAGGSRGGNVALIVGSVVFVGLWVARQRKFNPHSLLAPTMMAIATVCFGAFLALLMVSGRAHDAVLGSSEESALSNQSRLNQMDLAIPHILSNPFTGHGFAQGAGVVQYEGSGADAQTLDSYALSLLVETGVPGFVFFVLMVGGGIWMAARANLVDASQRGAMNGAFASALAAFFTNQIVLSERENHALVFWICGMIAVSAALSRQSIGTANDGAMDAAKRGARRVRQRPYSVDIPFSSPPAAADPLGNETHGPRPSARLVSF